MPTIDLALEFPISTDLCYLNHAAVSPWPRRTSQAVCAFAEENTTQGASHYPAWMKTESSLREHLAWLIGAASTRNIALQKNTSEGLSVIAYGLEWNPGDEIVITDQEFPSNRIVWDSLSSQGVTLVEAPIHNNDPEQSIINQLSSRVKLLSVSSVQYGNGQVLDLAKLGAACRERNIWFCIDAIQSLGAIPFSIEQYQADFVVADGHKWMLGPEGIALLYVSDKAINTLKLNQFGWHMVKDRGNYDLKSWSLAEDATRFECGSPNMLGIYALNASLSLLKELGMEYVNHLLLEKIRFLDSLLRQNPQLEIITQTTDSAQSGILTFKHKSVPSSTLYQQLMRQNVICAYRGGGVRFSPHFYTPLEVLEKAVACIPK